MGQLYFGGGKNKASHYIYIFTIIIINIDGTELIYNNFVILIVFLMAINKHNTYGKKWFLREICHDTVNIMYCLLF